MNLITKLLFLCTLFIFFSCKQIIEQPKLEVQQLKMATYDHQLSSKSCIECHSSNMPKMKISNLVHGGGLDCKICHNTNNWKNSKYGHTPLPNTCINCHLDKIPQIKDGFTHWSLMDCKDCHSIKEWKKSIYLHPKEQARCIYCHEKDNPYPFHGMRAECKYCHSSKDSSW